MNDNVTLVRGRHSMKAGFEIRVVDSERFQRGLPTHRYNNVAGLIADQPNDIQVIFGNPGRPLETTNYGIYVQDDWRLHDRLQLNAGLRYEYSPPLDGAFNVGGSDPFGPFQAAGEPMFDPDRNNFGPRLGLIYDARGDQSLIVRAGGGVMYGPPQPLFYYDMAFIDPNVPFLSSFTPTDIPAGLSIAFPFPQSFVTAVAADPSLLPVGLNLARNIADYDRADEYSVQWNGSVQYALTPRTSVQAAYVGSRANKLYSTRPVNIIDPATNARPVSGIGEILFRENAGRSKYDALQLSLNQRLWRSLAFDVYYTYGRSTGYYGPDGTVTSDASVQDPSQHRRVARAEGGRRAASLRQHALVRTAGAGLRTERRGERADRRMDDPGHPVVAVGTSDQRDRRPRSRRQSPHHGTAARISSPAPIPTSATPAASVWLNRAAFDCRDTARAAALRHARLQRVPRAVGIHLRSGAAQAVHGDGRSSRHVAAGSVQRLQSSGAEQSGERSVERQLRHDHGRERRPQRAARYQIRVLAVGNVP